MCQAGTFITIAEAAEMLETTETRILMMLKKNELQGKLADETWLVDKISLGLCNKPHASDIVKPGGCGICGSGCGSGC